MISSWPVFREEWCFDEDEKAVEVIKEAVRGIRNTRTGMNVPPSRKAKVFVVSESEEIRQIFEKGKVFFATLGYASEVTVLAEKTGIADDAVSVLIHQAAVYIPLAELVDIEKEIERLTKEQKKMQQEVKRCEGMLSNPKFVDKAPADKVQAEREKLEKYTQMLAQINERLAALK